MSDFIDNKEIKKRPLIGMVLYPEFTMLDLIGPHSVFFLHTDIIFLWKNMEPIFTDTNLAFYPTVTFEDCPPNLDVLFIPGSMNTNAAMQDEEIVSFVAKAGRTARYVTSVCSGSLLLGMADLLIGYKASAHWSCFGALAETGAIPVHERVVTDRNRVTGGGVTAGIDFGLTLLAKLVSEDAAKAAQLVIEYDPEPPFDAGSPSRVSEKILADALGFIGDIDAQMTATLRSRQPNLAKVETNHS